MADVAAAPVNTKRLKTVMAGRLSAEVLSLTFGAQGCGALHQYMSVKGLQTAASLNLNLLLVLSNSTEEQKHQNVSCEAAEVQIKHLSPPKY